MGGTDDPSNLMEVSIEEHAELHLALYLEYGRWQDWIAFNALSGQVEYAEATLQAIRHSSRETCIKRNATNNPMNNQETRDKMAKTRREWFKNNPEKEAERHLKIKESNTGKIRTEKHRQNYSDGATRRWKDPEARRRQSEAIKRSWKLRRINNNDTK